MKKVFKRSELKYKLTTGQFEDLKNLIYTYMVYDDFGKTKITNLYYDTPDYKIIRNSMEKPIYKEKLRVRKYDDLDFVFIELKKKYKGIVYKRRFKVSDEIYKKGIKNINRENQIGNEIYHFLKRYEDIDERVYLSYERESFVAKDDKNLRITFDKNIKSRDDELDFFDNILDNFVLPGNYVLMEIKTLFGYPKWLLKFLGDNHIYKGSFSKYGESYKNFIFPKLKKERI